jgi:hypothetical protein
MGEDDSISKQIVSARKLLFKTAPPPHNIIVATHTGYPWVWIKTTGQGTEPGEEPTGMGKKGASFALGANFKKKEAPRAVQITPGKENAGTV